MAQTRPFKTTIPPVDSRRMGKDYTQILTLFHLYFGSPPDFRQAIVEEILQQLASHWELQEPLFQEILRLGPHGRTLVKKIKVMILGLQQFRVADDQALDKFLEISARSS
jgi:hypothetical protein